MRNRLRSARSCEANAASSGSPISERPNSCVKQLGTRPRMNQNGRACPSQILKKIQSVSEESATNNAYGRANVETAEKGADAHSRPAAARPIHADPAVLPASTSAATAASANTRLTVRYAG